MAAQSKSTWTRSCVRLSTIKAKVRVLRVRKKRSSSEQAMVICMPCLRARHCCAFSSSFSTKESLTHGVHEVACHTPSVTQNELTKMWNVEIVRSRGSTDSIILQVLQLANQLACGLAWRTDGRVDDWGDEDAQQMRLRRNNPWGQVESKIKSKRWVALAGSR